MVLSVRCTDQVPHLHKCVKGVSPPRGDSGNHLCGTFYRFILWLLLEPLHTGGCHAQHWWVL